MSCLAVFYPLSWGTSSVVNSGPALIRAAVYGQKIQRVDVNYLGVNVFAGGPPGMPRRPPLRRGGIEWLMETSAAVAAAVALAGLLARRNPAPAGLAAALLGQAAVLQPAATLLFGRRLTTPAVLGLVLFLAVMGFGLRWMLGAAPMQGFAARAGTLFVAFVLPSAALPQIFYFAGRSRLPLAIPDVLAALLVSLLPIGGAKRIVLPARKMIPLGAAASLLLAAGVRYQGAAAERGRAAAHEAVMATLPRVPAEAPYPKLFFQKGVNFTSEFPNVYGSEGARKALEALRPHEVNAIALVPYGFSARGSTQVGFPGGMEPDEGIEELAAVAHSLGMKVLLKPHVWVRGGYPGDLEFANDAERRAWFGAYRAFVEHYAQLAKRTHADVFCVGLEFAKLCRYEDEWRKLIAVARGIYAGPLVYAANSGPEFETINFWDALDYIGLNEYYALPDDLSMDVVIRKVEAVQKKYNRPVILTEVGFSSYERPNREPWADRGNRLSLEDQARCYEAVFRAFWGKPWFQGMYWWKVGTSARGGPEDGSHTPWGKPAMEVVKRWYAAPPAASSAPKLSPP